MTKSDIETCINHWIEWSNTYRQYDIGIFKIWMNFEKYYSFLFRSYSMGGSSDSGYSPTLRIVFDSEEQFNIFLRNNTSFIDYPKIVPKLSPYIFNPNPFDIFINDTVYNEVFRELTIFRNFVAHESEESKAKVKSLSQFTESDLLNINSFLLRNKRGTSQTIFSYYIEKVKEMIDLLAAPVP